MRWTRTEFNKSDGIAKKNIIVELKKIEFNKKYSVGTKNDPWDSFPVLSVRNGRDINI